MAIVAVPMLSGVFLRILQGTGGIDFLYRKDYNKKNSFFGKSDAEDMKMKFDRMIPDACSCRSERDDKDKKKTENPGESIGTPGERLVNECLQYALSAEGYGATFDNLLTFIGSRFACARVYIFELNKNDTVSNTYEWCASGIAPQKELLQKEPISVISCWIEMFRENQIVTIENLEDIREEYPSLYAALKPQKIESLVICSLCSQGELIGFLGIDNPKKEQLATIGSFLCVIEYFVVSFMKRRDLSVRLEYISHHDQLTGVLNRRAYREKEKSLHSYRSMGIVYADITGLKRVNDQFGHLAGDDLICRCCRMLEKAFEGELIYRMGGDEFLVLCRDIPRERFFEKFDRLRNIIDSADCNMAAGASWGLFGERDLQSIVDEAEAYMYDEKKKFYAAWKTKSESGRRMEREIHWLYSEEIVRNIPQFLQRNPESIGPLVQAIAGRISPICLYVGDLETNTYYLSDNMCELFHFESNIVEDLLGKWERRICYPDDLQVYRRDIENMMAGKLKLRDYKYRVSDRDGKLIWVHCRSTVFWNEEQDMPRYFVGCMSRQEFEIDPVTSFPKEKEAIARLKKIREEGQHTVILTIGLNHYAEINETKGRVATDNLLRDIARYWESRLSREIWFCRLDGVRFMGIIAPRYADKAEAYIGEIRESIRNIYNRYHVFVKYPCSVCVFHYPDDIEDPETLAEKAVMFIEAAKNNVDQEYITYSPKDEDTYKSNAELILDLNEDVMNDFQNFRIVIQPIVSSEKLTVIGGEVLLRWNCQGKDISPAVFIPFLEKKGLICQVGRWVFEQAVRHCRRIVENFPDFHLSFNVSYRQISDSGFVEFMERTLAKYGVDASVMIMELTESHFDDEPDRLMQFVESCRKLGMSIALDDFGQGYSSLGLLLRYPANLVKLDRSLLLELADSNDKQKFLKTLVYACHEFGKTVCVEGVETEDAAQIIRETDGDLIQGFYYYRPLELNDFYETLHRSQGGVNRSEKE